MLDILEQAIGDDDLKKQLEIIEALDDILKDDMIISTFPQLIQLLFTKLFMLIKSDNKEVRVEILPHLF